MGIAYWPSCQIGNNRFMVETEKYEIVECDDEAVC